MLSYAGVSGYTRTTGRNGPCFNFDRKSNGRENNTGGIGYNAYDVNGDVHGGKAVARTAREGVTLAEGDSNGERNGTPAASHPHRTKGSRDGSDRGGVVSPTFKVSASGGSSTASEESDDDDGAEEGKSFDGQGRDKRREESDGDGPAGRATVGIATTSKAESVIGSAPPELDCLRGR